MIIISSIAFEMVWSNNSAYRWVLKVKLALRYVFQWLNFACQALFGHIFVPTKFFGALFYARHTSGHPWLRPMSSNIFCLWELFFTCAAEGTPWHDRIANNTMKNFHYQARTRLFQSWGAARIVFTLQKHFNLILCCLSFKLLLSL